MDCDLIQRTLLLANLVQFSLGETFSWNLEFGVSPGVEG